MKKNPNQIKPKRVENLFTVKVKTEPGTLGALKTIIVILLIALQAAILVLLSLYFMGAFRSYLIISVILTLFTCIHILSSNRYGQSKATWIFFMFISFGFGYFIYLLSDEHILFAKSKKKFQNIYKSTKDLYPVTNIPKNLPKEIKNSCNLLKTYGNFPTYTNCNGHFFSSGAQLYDDILENLSTAKKFIFMEFFIISNGVLLQRIIDILKEKAKTGVDIRIVYDDMGSHKTLKNRTIKDLIKHGIKIECFNRLVPVFNIALNLRDHRKIIVIDGKTAYTGGTNLADEYINEKRMHGYWKDEGIKLQGPCIDNLTISFLHVWQFLTNKNINYLDYINQADNYDNNSIFTPFVSGPEQSHSMAHSVVLNFISNSHEKLYIMTPYFIPDETIINMIINKAKAGVEIKIILPEIADKKFVYYVSRNNVEKLLDFGIKLYVMKSSFVHSKIYLNENSAIIGSINMDLRSFFQQFESAVFTNDNTVLKDINFDFQDTINHSKEITHSNKNRNKFINRLIAGIFNLISPFM